MALNRQQLDELKRIVDSRLLVLDAEIRAGAARMRGDATGAAAGGGMDRADVAVSDQIADLGNAELLRDVRELRGLEAALARFDAGSFGRCLDCGEEIGYDRLRAQPGAVRCFDCQRLHETTRARPAAPGL